jgi:transposase InsO family protein
MFFPAGRLGVSIQDLFYGFIISYHLTRVNSLELVLSTLKQAKQREPITDGLALHSDAALTQAYAITPSMSGPGNCWDNAHMENFFGHLKEEALRQFPLPSFEEAKHIIDDYIHFYNYERIQLNTKQTPYETRCLSF